MKKLIFCIVLILVFNCFINFRTPEELYTEYDPSAVAFKPTIPIPEKITVKKASIHHVMSSKLEEYLNTVDIYNLFTDGSVDFYKACKNNSK